MAVVVGRSQAYHSEDWASDETSLWVKLVFPSGASPVIVGDCYVPPAKWRNLRRIRKRTIAICNRRFAKLQLAAYLVVAQAGGHVLLGETSMQGLADWRLWLLRCSRSR